jgi:pyrroline-5-carboxylate reductase
MGRSILSGMVESGLLHQENITIRACVTREESANVIRTKLSSTIQIYVKKNVEAVQSSEAIILW